MRNEDGTEHASTHPRSQMTVTRLLIVTMHNQPYQRVADNWGVMFPCCIINIVDWKASRAEMSWWEKVALEQKGSELFDWTFPARESHSAHAGNDNRLQIRTLATHCIYTNWPGNNAQLRNLPCKYAGHIDLNAMHVDVSIRRSYLTPSHTATPLSHSEMQECAQVRYQSLLYNDGPEVRPHLLLTTTHWQLQ